MTSPASLRLSKLATYLPDYGWRPVIVTSDGTYSEYTASLEVPRSDISVTRVSDLDPLKKLAVGARSRLGGETGAPPSWAKRLYKKLVPDRDWVWGLSALRTARKLMRERNVSAVYSSFPNLTNHLVALKLKRLYNTPWVAEFRDPLTGNPGMSIGRFDLWKGWRKRVESRVCSAADFCVFVSPDYLAHFKHHQDLSFEETTVIYNGFDPGDFSFLLESKPSFPTFSIAHAGSFFEGQRGPEPLLKALKSLSQRGRIDLERVSLDFYGPLDWRVDRMLSASGLRPIATWHGTFGYKEILPHLCRAYCLLLIARHSFRQLPRKLFDYIGTTRPILALARDPSEVTSIVRRSGAGFAVERDRTEDLEQALIRLWDRWISGDQGWIHYSPADIEPFHSREQARLLAAVFDRVST